MRIYSTLAMSLRLNYGNVGAKGGAIIPEGDIVLKPGENDVADDIWAKVAEENADFGPFASGAITSYPDEAKSGDKKAAKAPSAASAAQAEASEAQADASKAQAQASAAQAAEEKS